MCGQGLGVFCAAVISLNLFFVFFGERSLYSDDTCLNSASADREIELHTGEGTEESAETSFILLAALQPTWCDLSPRFSCFMDRSGPIGASSIQICQFTL